MRNPATRLRDLAHAARLLSGRPTVARLRTAVRAGLLEYGANDPSMRVERGRFHAGLAAADAHFQAGRYHENVTTLADAVAAADRAAVDTGMATWNTRICGEGIVKYIGHMAAGLGVRARNRALGKDDVGYLVLDTSEVANPRLLRYWEDHFPVVRVTRSQAYTLERTLWPIVEHISWYHSPTGVQMLYQAMAECELAWEASGRPPLLRLREQDLEIGERYLADRGITREDWFVTLHVREDGKGTAYGRNARIADYQRAIDVITARGGHVVRLGTPSMTPLPTRPGVVDLVSARSPSVDVYALAACRFLIGTASGPNVVPALFGTPVLMTNVTGFGFLPYAARALAIPKLLAEDGRPLSLTDMSERGLAMLDGFVPTDRTGPVLRWRDNSAEEICAGVEEMLEGRFDRALDPADRRMAELRSTLVGYPGPRISSSFLGAHLE